MIRTGVIFGAIAGLTAITIMIAGLTLSKEGGFFASQWFGYLVMILALSMIYFGVKRHRDRELGGIITFGRALGLGLFIAAIAGIAYIAVWEIYLAATGRDFISGYAEAVMAQHEANGLAGAALEAERARMEQLIARYDNPLFRLAITFTEIFPVGVLVATVSAALLRTTGSR
ncbi:MAG: DUF4199 domain-containing protein [Parvularculaceae bacterium]